MICSSESLCIQECKLYSREVKLLQGMRAKLGIVLPVIILLEFLVLAFRVHGLHNSQLLVNVGDKIIHQANPYIPMQPYGASPGLIYWLIEKITFGTQSPFFFIGLNIAGIVLLINFMFPKETPKLKAIILSVLLLSSPIRALVASVQHTGIIIGAILLGAHLLRKSDDSKRSALYLLAGCGFFVFALEIKPQIAIPFVAVWIIAERCFKLIPIILLQFFLINLAIDLWVGRFLEIDRLNVWKLMRGDALTISEQSSLWKLLGHFTSSNIDWFKISFCIYLLGFALLLLKAFKNPKPELLRWALLLPVTTAYLHLYDIVILAIYIAFWTTSKFNRAGSFFLLGLVIIPTRFTSMSEVANGIAFLAAVAILLSFNRREISLKELIYISGEVVIAILAVSIISRLNMALEMRVSVQITVLMILTSIFLINDVRNSLRTR